MRNLNFLKLFYGLMLVMVSTAFVSCVDDNDDTEAPYLEVSPTTLIFGLDGQPANGSQASFDISTNRSWKATVKDDKSWVTLSKYEGEGSATIQVSIPENVNDEASVVIEISNKVGVLMSETVKISSGSVGPTEVIYNETVGDKAVSSPYPYVDSYDGWNKSGVGSANVTYSGASASVRASGLANSGAYDGASGPNVVFFGTLPAYFQINKIALTEAQTNLKLTFGASYSIKVGEEYDNTFDISKLTVALSADGTNWVPLTYTKNNGDSEKPYWVLATANFTLKKAVSELYIKYTALAASSIRLDDITLATGAGGTEIDLGNGGGDPDETTEITIPNLITKMTETETAVTQSYLIKGTICGDPKGLNYSKGTLYIMTQGATTAGNGLALYSTEIDATNYDLGDNIEVTLRSGTAKIYKRYGIPQANGFGAADIKVNTKNNAVTPITVTIDQLPSFLNMPVTVNDVTSSEAGVWMESANNTTIKDKFYVGSTALQIYFNYNAGDTFIGQPYKVAQNKSITGIASVYQEIGQIMPRNLEDVKDFNSSSPTITSVNPDSHTFPATGGSQAFNVSITNQGENTISVSGLSNAFTTSISANIVTVTAKANTGATFSETMRITLTNGNSIDIPLTVSGESSGEDTKGTFTSMTPFLFDNGTNNYGAYGQLVNTDIYCLKLGTSSKSGAFTTGALGVTGNKKFSFYATAWKGKTATIYIRINNGGSISGNNNIAPAANDGATGNPAYTITFADSDYYTFNLTGLTESSTITIATDDNFETAANNSNARAIMCGFQLY